MSRIIILLCWVIGILSAVLAPMVVPPELESIHIPFSLGIMMLTLPIAFFSAVTFFGPAQSPFYHPRLATYLNSRYGALAFETFLVQLKPLPLCGVASSLQGITTFWQSDLPYIFPGFFLSAGIAFIVAHLILYHRKAIGVYLSPAGGEGSTSESQPRPVPTKQPLKVALRLYWWCLIGVFLLPTIMVVGGEIYKIPFEFFIPLFFAVMFLAMWPVLSKRACYAFWLVAMVLWLGGGFMAAFITTLVRK